MSHSSAAKLAYCAVLNSLLFYAPLCMAVANPAPREAETSDLRPPVETQEGPAGGQWGIVPPALCEALGFF